ncbi:MAG TPA: helix-turn-helix domain-containing protein [Pyrinomonadaceae bacterium]|jgi:DNA-binding NtrC family response regulator|nr:helix-turn-helix domain-containing protein [Pyrinomonadaceae bacterium]
MSEVFSVGEAEINAEALQSKPQAYPESSLDELALAVKINCLKTLIHAFLAEVEHIEQTCSLNAGGLLNLREEVRRFELNLISSALKQSGNDPGLAARLLGIHLNTLNSKVKSYGISMSEANNLSEE